jgi:anti-sigma factor RsiW
MTCREFADFMMDYFDGALPSDVLQKFEWHISRCPNCRTYLAQYESTIAAERSAFAEADETLPPDVPEDLIQAILSTRRR